MVRYGFSLSEVRQMYMDEVLGYFEQLVSLLEKEGVLKPGASSAVSDGDEVDALRSQLKSLKLL